MESLKPCDTYTPGTSKSTKTVYSPFIFNAVPSCVDANLFKDDVQLFERRAALLKPHLSHIPWLLETKEPDREALLASCLQALSG